VTFIIPLSCQFAVTPDKDEIHFIERDLNAQEESLDIKLCGISSTTGKCDQYIIIEKLEKEAHQGVMTDRPHSLKRRQTTTNDIFRLGKSDKLRFVLWVKSDSDIYYNKTSDKGATKLVTSNLGYTLGGPCYMS
jgi:hypothetical protein